MRWSRQFPLAADPEATWVESVTPGHDRSIGLGNDVAGNVISLTQSAAVMRGTGLTFADDNGLLAAHSAT
jgi:hypothetical protein